MWKDSNEFNSQENEESKYGLSSHLLSDNTTTFLKEVWNLWDEQFWSNFLLKQGYDQIYFNGISARNKKCFKPFNSKILEHGKSFKNTIGQYIEIGSSNSKSKLPFGRITDIGKILTKYEKIKDNEEENKKQIILLHESFVTRIGIVDERIQSFCQSKYSASDDEEICFFNIFKKTGIYLPKKQENNNSIDLNSSNFQKDQIGLNLKKWLKESAPKLDFLLIHLGIIEKLEGGSDVEKIRASINNIQKFNHSLNIILISGRGKPHNLPGETRFLNYSQVANYTSDGLSKFMLTDLCQSARKTDI